MNGKLKKSLVSILLTSSVFASLVPAVWAADSSSATHITFSFDTMTTDTPDLAQINAYNGLYFNWNTPLKINASTGAADAAGASALNLYGIRHSTFQIADVYSNNSTDTVKWTRDGGLFGKASDDYAMVQHFDKNGTAVANTKQFGSYLKFTNYMPERLFNGGFNKILVGVDNDIRISYYEAFENLNSFRPMTIRWNTASENVNQQVLNVTDTGVVKMFGTTVEGFSFEENKWHKIDIMLDHTANEITATNIDVDWSLYVDNVLVGTGTWESNKALSAMSYVAFNYTVNANDYKSQYTGDATNGYKAAADRKTYFDDITFSTALTAPTPIAASSTNAEYSSLIADSSSTTLYAPFGCTVEDYKANVTIKEGETALEYDFYRGGVKLDATDKIAGAYVQIATSTGVLYGSVDAGEILYCETFDGDTAMDTKMFTTGNDPTITLPTGVSTKGSNDNSLCVTTQPATAEAATSSQLNLTLSAIEGLDLTAPLTIEASILATGKNIDKMRLWMFNYTGVTRNSDYTDLSTNVLKDNQWHRIAISYCPNKDTSGNNGRLIMYLDGKEWINLAKKMDKAGWPRFQTYTKAAEGTATLCMDDIYVYQGAYQPDANDDTTPVISTEDDANTLAYISESEDKIYVSNVFENVATFVDYVTVAGGSAVKAYTDSTFTKEVTNETKGILITTSGNQECKAYYDVVMCDMALVDANAAVAADRSSLTYTGKLLNFIDEPTTPSVTVYAATYAGKKLTSVDLYTVPDFGVNDINKTFTLIGLSDAEEAKIMVWQNDMTAVADVKNVTLPAVK